MRAVFNYYTIELDYRGCYILINTRRVLGGKWIGFIINALKDNSPKVVLDDKGIAASEWGGMRIEWEDVLDVKVVTLPRIVSVTLELRDEEKYLIVLSKEQRIARKMSKQFYGQSFSFVATALDASTESIYASIKHHLRTSPNDLI